MTDLRWPSPVPLVVAHLAAVLDDDVKVVPTKPPARDLRVSMPLVSVVRGPGSDDGVTDTPAVDVEGHTATEDAGWTLAEDIRDAMHQLSSATVTVAGRRILVDRVNTSVSPVEVPYGRDVFRTVATYRLALRKTRA